jgi:4'-phosphopantetheinyl transferase
MLLASGGRRTPVRIEGQWSIESTRGPGEYPDEGCIDVWLCSYGAPDDVLWGHLDTLDRLEKARSAAFRGVRARSAFVARRSIVRIVASRYLGVHSGDLAWKTGPTGKPFLWTEAGQSGLEFSWSQASAAVVIAVTLGIPVGVDACQESDGESLDGLVDVFCSEDEASALARLSTPQRIRALVRCWTAKEACLKAVGTGLRCDPRRLRTWGESESLETVEWDEEAVDSPRCHMTVVHRSVAGGTALAVGTPIPLRPMIHGLTWNGGDEHGQR